MPTRSLPRLTALVASCMGESMSDAARRLHNSAPFASRFVLCCYRDRAEYTGTADYRATLARVRSSLARGAGTARVDRPSPDAMARARRDRAAMLAF